MERLSEEVKNVRGELKRRMKELEREWWGEKINECERACLEGRVGDMYKCLRKIGTKGKPKARGMTVTVDEFKEHFESVSNERYENDPSVIAEVVRGAKDLRRMRRAKEANDLMNEVPEREEIEEAMKDMSESAPGEDGVRIGYIRNACERVKERVIDMVRDMFESKAEC